jgi:hypothetical protein
MMLFMPLIVLGVMIAKVNKKLKIYELLIIADPNSCFCSILLFILYLPYNLLIISVMVVLCSIAGIPLMMVLLWPAYFYNTRRFIRVIRYWSGKARYVGEVDVAKITFKQPTKNLPAR